MHRPRPTVLVTRPEPQASDWVRRLQAVGVEAQALPLLGIEQDAGFVPAVQRAHRDLAAARWALVMFVSPNAVLQFFQATPAAGWPAGTLAGATGPGTVAALQSVGVPLAAIAQPRADAARFDAEALWHDALAARDWTGRAVLIVRGETGRDWLADTLQAAGAAVERLAAYRQTAPDWSAPFVGADTATDPGAGLVLTRADGLRHGASEARAGRWRPVWLFSSSQAIAHLIAHLGEPSGDDDAAAALRRWPALATHPRIAETARAAGFVSVHEVRPDPGAVAAWVHTLDGDDGSAPGPRRYNPSKR